MVRSFLILLAFAVIAIAAENPSNQASRILGGRNVGLGELPYQASLQYWGTTFHFAAGILLSNRWVVSTAHGVFGRAQNSINIILGIVRLDSAPTGLRSMEIRIHPLFDVNTKANDIATIRSSVAITFTSMISPITLSPMFVSNGDIGHVSGWGAMNENKLNEAIVLQKAFVTVGSCVNSEFITFTPSQHFCAGSSINATEVVGICTRDVGGPFVINNMVAGIPFFHDPRFCGQSLDGYLRMSFYRGWIMGNIPA